LLVRECVFGSYLLQQGWRGGVAAGCKKPTNRPIRTQDCAQIAHLARKTRPQPVVDPLLATGQIPLSRAKTGVSA
jgi:hypothetical protein